MNKALLELYRFVLDNADKNYALSRNVDGSAYEKAQNEAVANALYAVGTKIEDIMDSI